MTPSTPDREGTRTYAVIGLSAVEYAVLMDLVLDQVAVADRAGFTREIDGRPVPVLKAIARRFPGVHPSDVAPS